jgi:putative acetyltransferase
MITSAYSSAHCFRLSMSAASPSPPASSLVIASDSPLRDDVRALLETHLALMYASSAPEDVHALDVQELLKTDFVSVRNSVNGKLLGVGALLQLTSEHVELKSMHTAAAARGKGIGRALLRFLIARATNNGVKRMSLETGSDDVFATARALYASEGFALCDPFASYEPSAASTFMTMELQRPDAASSSSC